MLEELKKALDERLEKAKYLSKKQVNGKWVYKYAENKGKKKNIKTENKENEKTSKGISLKEAKDYFKKFAEGESYNDWIEAISADSDDAQDMDDYFNGNIHKLMTTLLITGNSKLDIKADLDDIDDFDNLSQKEKYKLKEAAKAIQNSLNKKSRKLYLAWK